MNKIGLGRVGASLCLAACSVAMLFSGIFSAKGQGAGPTMDSPALNGDGQLHLTVHGVPNFVYELQGSQDLTNWVPVQQQGIVWNTNATSFACGLTYRWRYFRARGVGIYDSSLLRAGFVVRNSIEIRGSGFVSDSFNSSNANYSSWMTNATWGTNLVYDVSKRRDHGNVAVMGGATNSVNIGSAEIYGRILTSPSAVILTRPNGSVGDLAWQTSGNFGIEPWFSSDQFNMDFPAVTAPTGAGIVPGPGTYTGTNYNYMLSIPSMLYTMNTPLFGKVCVTGSNVVLWAKAGINFSGASDGIFVAPGASVTVYVGDVIGTNVSANFNGGGGINAIGYARNCQICGLNTCTNISVTGPAPFVGTIYAPYADLTGGGGGNNDKDWMGYIVVNNATITGHVNFHYDEALSPVGQ